MIKETLRQEPGTIQERINARLAAKFPGSSEELDAVLRQEGYLCGPAQTIRHEYGGTPDKVKVKLERNISATGSTVDEALAMIADAKAKLEKAYGAGITVPSEPK